MSAKSRFGRLRWTVFAVVISAAGLVALLTSVCACSEDRRGRVGPWSLGVDVSEGNEREVGGPGGGRGGEMASDAGDTPGDPDGGPDRTDVDGGEVESVDVGRPGCDACGSDEDDFEREVSVRRTGGTRRQPVVLATADGGYVVRWWDRTGRTRRYQRTGPDGRRGKKVLHASPKGAEVADFDPAVDGDGERVMFLGHNRTVRVPGPEGYRLAGYATIHSMDQTLADEQSSGYSARVVSGDRISERMWGYPLTMEGRTRRFLWFEQVQRFGGDKELRHPVSDGALYLMDDPSKSGESGGLGDLDRTKLVGRPSSVKTVVRQKTWRFSEPGDAHSLQFRDLPPAAGSLYLEVQTSGDFNVPSKYINVSVEGDNAVARAGAGASCGKAGRTKRITVRRPDIVDDGSLNVRVRNSQNVGICQDQSNWVKLRLQYTAGPHIRGFDVAELADGGHVIVWRLGDTVYAHRFGGRFEFQKPVRVGTMKGEGAPQAAAYRNVGFIVAWAKGEAPERDVTVGLFDGKGSRVRSPRRFITPGDQVPTDIDTYDGEWRGVVAFESDEGPGRDVGAVVFEGRRAAWTVFRRVNTRRREGDQLDPSVAVLASGDFVVAFRDNQSRLWTRRFNRRGRPVKPPYLR